MPMRMLIDTAAALFDQHDWAAARVTAQGLREVSPGSSPTQSLLADKEHAIAPPRDIKTLLEGDGTLSECATAVKASFLGLNWYRSPRSGTAFTQVVGPGSSLHNDLIRFGLFLLPLGSDYPNHVHGADEIYIVLAGKGEWSIDNGPFETKGPGDFIGVPSMTVHALRSPSRPVLMFWSWTGDITLDRYRFTD